MQIKSFYFILFLYFPSSLLAQITDQADYTFDFNEQVFKEKNNKLQIKALNVTLTEDRFGNPLSAAYMHGSSDSYINLGTSNALKPQIFSLSLWFNLVEPVYAGTGDFFNPIIITKNPQLNDFFNVAYGVGYSLKSKYILLVFSRDSVYNVTISSNEIFTFGKWHHVMIVVTKDEFIFYLDGVLLQKVNKNFNLEYLAGDSVMIGNGASKKNNRWTWGKVDDIQFFNRALSEQDVLDLYLAPNPNTYQNIVATFWKFGSIIFAFIILIVIVLLRNRRALRRQKYVMEMNNKISELELKVLKAQISPKFISICLNAISNLISPTEVEKAGQYIAKFSLFLRMILNFSDRNFIALKDELEVMKLNLELLSLINGHVFEVKYNIDSDLNLQDINIPALITLPFVENAALNAVLNASELRLAELSICIFQLEDIIGIDIINTNYMSEAKMYKVYEVSGKQLVNDKLNYLNEISGELRIEIHSELFEVPDIRAIGNKFSLKLFAQSY